MVSSNLCISIKMTTVAEDCEARDTSLDNLWSYVVPAITQKKSKIPLCVKLIPFDAGTPNTEEVQQKWLFLFQTAVQMLFLSFLFFLQNYFFLSEFIIIITAETIPIITKLKTTTIIIVPLFQEKSVVSFMIFIFLPNI